MSSSNPPNKPLPPAWFSEIIMSNLKNYINELEKQVEKTGKEKYLEPFDNFMAEFEEIEKMNEKIRVESRFQHNADGTVKLDGATGKVLFHPELDDQKVLARLDAMQRNLQKIIKNSNNTFNPDGSEGIMVNALIALCDDIKKFHINTKQAFEMKYLKDYFEENKQEHKEFLQVQTQKEPWFDQVQMDKLNYSFALVKDYFHRNPGSEKALNGISASLNTLSRIDTLNKISGPYVRDEQGNIQVNKMGVEFMPALDDPNISGAINAMVQQAIELSKLVTPKSQVSLVLQEIINTELFEKHREKKQLHEQSFFKQFYQETSQGVKPEISIASTTRNFSTDNSELSSPQISPSVSTRSSRAPSISDFSDLSADSNAPGLRPPIANKAAVYAVQDDIQPEAQQAIAETSPAKASNFWRYALIGVGIALGTATIATGFGAVIGIPLLAVSVGFAVAELTGITNKVKPGDYSGFGSEDLEKALQQKEEKRFDSSSTAKLFSGLSITKESVKESLRTAEKIPLEVKAENKIEVTPNQQTPALDYSNPPQNQTPRRRI